jgi:hypothetical protein
MSDRDDHVLNFPQIECIDLNAKIDELRKRSGRRFCYYKLVGHLPGPVESALVWAMKFEERSEVHRSTGSDPWSVARTTIGKVAISTAFLGLDHSRRGGGPPILFETVIDAGKLNNFRSRCSTWDEAEAMHDKAINLVRAGRLKTIK